MPIRNSRKDGPDPIDIHVGKRVRIRRNLLGVSQTTLADRVGLTFQQIQKYEKGANRISASTLWRIAESLDVPISFFFDGVQAPRRGATQIDEIEASASDIDVLRDLHRVTTKVRRNVAGLVKSLAHVQKT